MELARSIAQLLSWQWVIIILALSFLGPLRRLLDRIVGFKVGGKKGLEARLTAFERQAGKVVESEPTEEKYPKRLDAELFVLLDKQGKQRAKLGVTDTDSTILSLYDSKENERISIFVLPDGSSTLALYDDDQRIRAMLAQAEMAGVAGLSIFGPDGRNGVNLLVSSEGEPSFDITDQRGLHVA